MFTDKTQYDKMILNYYEPQSIWKGGILMKNKNKLFTLLLVCLIAFGGCSRPVSDTPPVDENPSPSADENQQQDAPDDKPSAEDSSEQNNEPKEDDDKGTQSKDDDETDKDNQDEIFAQSSQGCYKIFDSGFEITVSDPFNVTYDELANNMTITMASDPSCRGYIFYDSSEQSMNQLEQTVKQMEDAYKSDPTINDMQKYVDDKQENGLFSFTFTYSAGAVEGSPAGFYFIHYQKADKGVISANLFTERSSNSDDIMKLIDSIQPATENAEEYGK